ncbi:MAG: hypothetical protein ACK528_14995 [Alphaproteobacteria bacterium]
MNKYLATLIDRLSQESTWRGLIQIAAGFGAMIEPEKAAAIIALGMFVSGTINAGKNK